MTEEVRTIRQAIKDSLDMTEDKEIIVDGEKHISHGILPLPFRHILTNMAAILYITTAQVLKKPIDDDIVGVFTGRDFLKGLFQYMQLGGFLEWWLEREAVIDTSGDGDSVFWYDLKQMIDAWNEYAEKEAQKHDKAGFFKNRRCL